MRELRGIGPGIEARLRELVETGELAELRELESEVMPELVAVGRLLGLSPKRMRELGSALDVRTLEELRAVEPDRLESVPGIGPKTAARIREGLAGLRREVRPRHGLTLNRARALVGEIAAALGGEPAGDPRRFCDLSTRLAVVVPSTGALLELERLPQIVSVLEREDDRAVGVTVEGIPVEVIAATPEGFGTALLRATGSPEYVASLGPLPEARHRGGGVTRRSGVRSAHPSCASWTRPTRRRICSSSSTFAATSTCTRRPRTERRRCSSSGSRRASSATSTSRSATTRRPSASSRGSMPTGCGARPRRSPSRTRSSRRSGSCAGASATSSPTARSTSRTTFSPSSSGCRSASTPASAQPAAELTARVVEAMRHAATTTAASCLSHPLGRILNHRPENALDLDHVFEVALETGVALEVNGLPDRLDLSGTHVRRALAAGVKIVCSTDAHSVRGLRNMALSVGTARRGGARRGDVLNTLPLAELLTPR